MAEYEWLTKGKRTVRIVSYVDGKKTNDKVEQRMVYPPAKGKIYPTINWAGDSKDVIPQANGSYLTEFHIRSVKAYSSDEVMHLIKAQGEPVTLISMFDGDLIR